MIELPDKRKCYNLPEQVAQNLRNITFLAEQYKNIDEIPAEWRAYKEIFDAEKETFEGWETTFEGWDTTLSTYLTNMSTAAVSAIAGQNIAPANISATGGISAPEIIESMSGYSASLKATDEDYEIENVYTSAVKNGNKLTLVCAFKITQLKPSGALDMVVVRFNIPSAVGAKLYPTLILNNNCLSYDGTNAQPTDQYSGTVSCDAIWLKYGNTQVGVNLYKYNGLTQNQEYYVRLEKTFLLADNLIS